MSDDRRSQRLKIYFDEILTGKKALQSRADCMRFIESVVEQPNPTICITRIATTTDVLSKLQTCMVYCVTPKYLNEKASDLLNYLQDQAIRDIDDGNLLPKIALAIAESPMFWDAFVKEFRAGTLEPKTQQCFGWLLSELVGIPIADKALPYQALAKDPTIQKSFASSPELDVRNIGQQIKYRLELLDTSAAIIPHGSTSSFPGGRNDNDFADFRRISILPTPDELLCSEAPFLRAADAIDDPDAAGKRVQMHLDSQFRLLREDMIGAVRDDVQIVLGKKAGKIRGVVVETNRGFEIAGADCEKTWAIKIRLDCGIPKLKGKTRNEIEGFLKSSAGRNIFRSDALVAIFINNKLVAFAVNRRYDDDGLKLDPPVITLELRGKSVATTVLMKLMMNSHVKLVQIDASLFSYEPVLRRLQDMRDLPLSEEILDWEPNQAPILPEKTPTAVIRTLKNDPRTDLQSLLGLTKSIKLDKSQYESLMMALTQRVSLIQGPPGTGKSFIGALLAKILFKYTDTKILVVCFTNHALDQFLEDLMDIGIPADDMVRLGSKSTDRTKSLSLFDQSRNARHGRDIFNTLRDLRTKCDHLKSQMELAVRKFSGTSTSNKSLLSYIEFLPEDNHGFFDAFTKPDDDEEFQIIGEDGKPINDEYLFGRWRKGQDAGKLQDIFINHEVWKMSILDRLGHIAKWETDILEEHASEICDIGQQYNEAKATIKNLDLEKNVTIMKHKRIIGCTTTGAAMFSHELRSVSAGVLLVEEAGEILESHILTSLGKETQQLILIGDHKQLRPKVANYELTVAKMSGFDLDRSLFERLVLKGYPNKALSRQFRMRPEISRLVRELTYPDLTDGDKTHGRPDIRGLQSNVIFIHHTEPEGDEKKLANQKDMSLALSSKKNRFEAALVLKIVKYLGQQGYGTKRLVVLSPYLGQLSMLREVLSKENDPVLNDLDYHDLLRAGLITPSEAATNKGRIHLSSIDNYQGEEADIVIISMTRSNPNNDIGFMSDPNRLTVLLSRARDGLIMVGNANTFKGSRKGKEVWCRFFDLLKEPQQVYEGLPVKCERHPDKKATLVRPEDFDEHCPDGGCNEPCGQFLKCKKHKCQKQCHQIDDHSKVKCDFIMEEECEKGHKYTWRCHEKKPETCQKCNLIEKQRLERLRREVEAELEREKAQAQHLKVMEDMDNEIEEQRRRIKEAHEARSRELAIRQKKKDLEDAISMAAIEVVPLPPRQSPPPPPPPAPNSIPAAAAAAGSILGMLGLRVPTIGPSLNSPVNTTAGQTQPVNVTVGQTQPINAIAGQTQPVNSTAGQTQPVNATPKLMKKIQSASAVEWQWQKDYENAKNTGIDEIMDMIGLEDVKAKILTIKDKIETSLRQGTDLSKERMGLALLGNPGTGKTTIARSYGLALAEMGVLPGKAFKETTGSWLGFKGIDEAKEMLLQISNAGGGVFFIDEAYQLTEGNNFGGKLVLDFLLTEIENNVGKIVFIIAGYNKQMESFFEHNPGIPSRIPWTLKFADYKDNEFLEILIQYIKKKYQGKMRIEGGEDGLYMRIVVRRVGRGRGTEGFGNARTLHNAFAKISERQAKRISKERRAGWTPDLFLFTKEDLIGPDPAQAILKSKAWTELQKLIGLDTVKQSVQSVIDSISLNYKRELEEKSPVQDSLNRVFLGSPGTGKTTVAGLVGQIYADCGVLSNGEVMIKNPSDFIGAHIGESEKNTKAILQNSIGKVLIIDEAYGLYTGGGASGSGNHSDSFKTAVIDTLVSMVQSVPGEDRCVLLLGYKDNMVSMFDNVNPGLARRFRIEDAFQFQDFSATELRQILDLKLKTQELGATDAAKNTALEVLGRMRRRPNFGNAGEVENLLSKAKNAQRLRERKKPVGQRAVDVIFEPEDFDVDHDRDTTATLNCKKLFADVIGRDDVAAKMEGYQKIAHNMKELGEDPTTQIPTNFVFKGPPGTGKTTTARKMGQVYYDMGFLAAAEVVECSASDLVGQYIGQTGPKTRKVLEKGLGKVLFIDEAYRLAEGHFAQEAIDELVDILTKPQYAGNMVVILAGYDSEMNRLMAVNPGLSSRFPEEIIFTNMSPAQCLQLLDKDLSNMKITLPELKVPTCPEYLEMTALIDQLSALPSWGNGRDVKTLAKEMIGCVFKDAQSSRTRQLPINDAISCIKTMLSERRSRVTNIASNRGLQRQQAPQPPIATQTSAPPAPPPPSIITATSTAPTPAPPVAPPVAPKPPRRKTRRGQKNQQLPPATTPPPNAPSGPSGSRGNMTSWQQQRPQTPSSAGRSTPPSPAGIPLSPRAFNRQNSGAGIGGISSAATPRDQGVSDQVWAALQAASQARIIAERREKQIAEQQSRQILAAKAREAELERQAAAAAQQARDNADRKRMLDEARRRQKQARDEREKIERAARAREAEKEREKQAQRKLQNMGRCVQGYEWLKMPGGWRCRGGTHFVTDRELN